MRHPEGQQNHDHHSNRSAYKAESPVIGLPQTDRLSRSMILHLLEKLIRH